MYENYYGLTEKPFSLLPDPDYLYLSRHHQKALTLLEYGILNQAGFCVISGQAGAGKTTLIRQLLNRFDKDTTIGLLSNTHASFEELLAWILMSFDLPYQNKSKTELYQCFVDFLIEQYAQKRHTVLIIDEAQNMSPAALEELRMLSNINADKDQLLQMILMGQPGLLKNLQRPELRQFAQRIAVDYQLGAMNEKETCAYIRHRLKVAGADMTIFNDDACKAVYYHSRGLPRLINLLCDTALVYGFAENLAVIDKRIIDDVVKERDENTILPHYHELNEETVLMEDNAALNTNILEENEDASLSVQGKMTSCGETASHNKKPFISKSTGSNHKQLNSANGVVSSIQKASVTSLKQAEYFSKAMALQNKSETISSDEHIDMKSVERSEDTSNVITVNKKIDNKRIDDLSDTESKPESFVATSSGQGVGKLSFIILGFAFGILISAALLILYKMDNLTQPTVDETEIAGRMQAIEDEFARKLQAIEQQREADLNKARLMAQEKQASQARAAALQRERDAALAIAKAREELLQAKLKAERAIQRERLAAEKASLAQERARAIELETKLRQQQKREAALAAARSRQELKTESAEKENPVKVGEAIESFTVEPIEVETAQTVSTNTRRENKAKSNKETGFSSNPCEGPTAVLLSTCKK